MRDWLNRLLDRALPKVVIGEPTPRFFYRFYYGAVKDKASGVAFSLPIFILFSKKWFHPTLEVFFQGFRTVELEIMIHKPTRSLLNFRVMIFPHALGPQKRLYSRSELQDGVVLK